ncbi:Germin-like protein 5-1 [Citrus sinensis]|nr:Germin-like protein 5-1 [Citrus sinensis]
MLFPFPATSPAKVGTDRKIVRCRSSPCQSCRRKAFGKLPIEAVKSRGTAASIRRDFSGFGGSRFAVDRSLKDSRLWELDPAPSPRVRGHHHHCWTQLGQKCLTRVSRHRQLKFGHRWSAWVFRNNKIIIELTFVTMAAAAAGALTLFVVTVAVILNTAAADPEMLQDVCVADLTSPIKVNGFPCKANFSEMDFFSDKLAKPAATNNTFGSTVTAANVQTIPGLNTLGVSLARIDYAPGGINPPHTHPRATEIVFVLEGQLDVGFFTTANVLVSKSIKKGENFVFPRGLVHFQKNNGNVPASVIAGFNSQLQGTQNIALTLFASTPPVADNVLTKTFQIGTKEVEKIKSRLAPKK